MLDGLKALLAEHMFHPAGVLPGGLFIHPQVHQQVAEHGMALIDLFGQGLAGLGPRFVAPTGVRFEPDKLGVMYYDKVTGQYGSYFTQRLPASFHGTGDIFASTCVGGLTRGLPLGDALALAADYTVESIRLTLESPDANWYGVEFERAIPYLVQRMN